jgi:hypothetical protein
MLTGRHLMKFQDNLEKRNSQRNFVKNRKLADHVVVSSLLLQTSTRPLSSFRLLGTDSGNFLHKYIKNLSCPVNVNYKRNGKQGCRDLRPHCKGNSVYIFLFWELRGLSPNFYIHVSMCFVTWEMVAWKRALEAGQRPENHVEDPEKEGDETSALFYLRKGGMEGGTGSRSETRKLGGRPRRRWGWD